MALPDTLERLNQISIDTLGLSESTLAVVKWHAITSILDCIVYFYERSQEEGDPDRFWRGLFRLMFGEVEPALIAAGYWDLVMDAEVWRVLKEQNYHLENRTVVHWQGRDQDLSKITLEQIGLPEVPASTGFGVRCTEIGCCIETFVSRLQHDSEHWLDIYKIEVEGRNRHWRDKYDEYLFELVQPRLVQLGLWRFVEEYVDDFDVDIFGIRDDDAEEM